MTEAQQQGFVMDRVKVDLENCYGIKKLSHEFDFSDGRVYAIYAPNGSMKSSLARTFRDLAVGKPSEDRIFTGRVSLRTIKDENGADIPPDSVHVVFPYPGDDEAPSETSTLLVNPTLRREYEQLFVPVNAAKERLLSKLKEKSRTKLNIEGEISSAFTSTEDNFYRALIRVKDEIAKQPDAPLADVTYDIIFNDDVLKFLDGKDIKTELDAYIKRYNELLAQSTFFKKGIFDYYNADQIAGALAKNGFFKANHVIRLKGNKEVEVTTEKELAAVIEKERADIIKDTDLQRRFAAMATKMDKNATLRAFRSYIMGRETILPYMSNIRLFKEEAWKSYLKDSYSEYVDLLAEYETADAQRIKIETQAQAEKTQWEKTIDIFNKRFIVPFRLEIKNKIGAVLHMNEKVELDFVYRDDADEAAVEEKKLLETLSTGERRAFYLLGVIFEIKVRRQAGRETFLVIDDIADSFDYQNKYAIIQYLHETASDGLFKQLIMTHNFDFFRTIHRRGVVGRKRCLMALRTKTGVSLEEAVGIKNVFIDWRNNFFKDPKKKIACIPFMRNLVEMTEDIETNSTYVKLTSLLHWKADTSTIIEDELNAMYTDMFDAVAPTKSVKPVIEIIRAEAESCLKASIGMNLENKIVLAIAIRLDAERFMVNRINDPEVLKVTPSNQTYWLLKEFKTRFAGETDAIGVLDRVMLMTPENIHLNSFMYEPIIDMSDEHLRQLYTDVLALK